MHPVHALWCHPRSMSTAAERIMRERGDLTVLHEPFLHFYYAAKATRGLRHYDPPSDRPTDYAGTRAEIRAAAATGPAFFKDMAYYADAELLADPDFAGEMTHAFLVRDPAESILSYARLDPDMTCEEIGIEAQWRLFDGLRRMGLDPIVLRSDQVRRDPAGVLGRYWREIGLADRPEALSWDAGRPEDWGHVGGWHEDVGASTGIRPPDPDRDARAELAALGPPYADYEAHHRPFYERLAREAL